MKKILIIGLGIMILLAGIAFAQGYNPYRIPSQSVYGYALTGYDPYYTSEYPYYHSIYTDVTRGGPDRITNLDVRAMQSNIPNKIQTTVYLAPVGGHKEHEKGFPPYAPRGTARVYSSQSRAYASGEVSISTKDIAPSDRDNTVYEAWLFDSKTGYRTSMGVFKAIFGGVGVLTYRVQTYLDGYDYIIITKEPANDQDPRPSDEIVLLGPITVPSQYTRPFTYTQSQYGYVTKEAMN